MNVQIAPMDRSAREAKIVEMTVQVLERINQQRTTDGIFDLFREFTTEISIETYSYHILSDQYKHLPFAQSLQQCTFSEEWVKHYNKQDYYQIDPIMKKAISSVSPFHWYEIENTEEIMANQRRMLSELRDEGFVDGLAVPVFGPDKVTAFFGLGSYEDELDFTPKELTAVQIVCQNTHLRSFDIAGGIERKTVNLSERELEILGWIAHGKSNDVISNILGISKHTVDTHVKRAMAKLDTSSRVTAVVVAMQMGLLRL